MNLKELKPKWREDTYLEALYELKLPQGGCLVPVAETLQFLCPQPKENKLKILISNKKIKIKQKKSIKEKQR